MPVAREKCSKKKINEIPLKLYKIWHKKISIFIPYSKCIPFSGEGLFLMLQSRERNKNSTTPNTPDCLIKFFPDFHSGYSEAPIKYSYMKFNGAGVYVHAGLT